jgi:hypothetical protein
MLLSKIIYDIQNLRNGGIQSDDNKLSDKEVKYLIDTYRATFIRQEIGKNYIVDSSIIQELKQVNIVQVNLTNNKFKDCNTFRISTDLTIPAFISAHTGILATYVGTVDGESFQKTTRQKASYDIHLPYTGNEIRWYIVNNDIYILSPKNRSLKYISIQGVFENPSDVREFNGEVVPFEYFDYDYPIKANMVDLIKKAVAEMDYKLLAMFKEDTLNNSK